jgi:hypothetical protein
MNTLTLILILVSTSFNSFGDVLSSLNPKNLNKKAIFSEENIDKQQISEISETVHYLNLRLDYPVVDPYSAKIKLGLEHVKKCISEESQGTVGDYSSETELKVTAHSSGLFKNLEILNSESMPLYLKACFLSGFSRVIYAQPMDGYETTMFQKFKMKLSPEDPKTENRLVLNLIGNASPVLPAR